MEVTGLGALSGIGTAISDRQTIADNFDTFLQILTTQLRNQNPLDPLDTNEFTSQLVQFSSVEQAIKTNDNLETMLRLSVASTATAAVSYIGKVVTADGAVSQLSNGGASWAYTANGAINSATVTIRDVSGNIVFSDEQPVSASSGTYYWDGRRSDGTTAPDGSYQISISGKSSSGAPVSVTTHTRGIVDGVDLSGSEPVLLVGKSRVNLSSVSSVSQN